MLRQLGRQCRVSAALLAVLISGCATAPPVQEMSDARQAIAAARDAGAEQFAASRLAEAQALLDTAEEYLGWDSATGYWSARRAALSAKETAFDALLISRQAQQLSTEAVESLPSFR